ncbi:MAG: phytoene/squalene synthase family protein [Halobacteriales archaeon]
MVSREQIRQSKSIQRHTGRTFHLATRVLPERVRYPTYVLYAFFRMADEVVDDSDPAPPPEQRRELRQIRAAALGERKPDDPVLAAFSDLRERHDVPREEVETFVDSMLMDVDTDRCETHEELSTYLRGSAAAVGYMMLELMDPTAKETARPHAGALGKAFQLTNFLRDVREDVVELDRIYLPEELLAAHGASHEQVANLEYTPEFAAAVREHLRRTERRYHEGVDGIRYLPDDCQFAVLAAAVMYADQHRLIRERDCDVLSARPTLTLRRRLSLVVRAWLHWQRTDDPLAVFYPVTDLEPPEDAQIDEPADAGRLRSAVGAVRSAAAGLLALVSG